MTTTQSTAKINAYAAVNDELVALGANNGEIASALSKWSDLVSGRRPGYYAAHCKVVDEFRAEKGLPVVERPGQAKAAPAPVAPVVDEAAFEAAAPVVEETVTPKEAAAKVRATAKAAKNAEKAAAKVKADEAKAAKTAAAAKAKAEKVPARKIETVKNAPGQFLRQRRLVRRTKSVVAIFDLQHADAAAKFGEILLPDGSKAKYLVVDEDHGQQVGVKNYESAWRIALDPAQFCTACPKG